MLDYKIGNEVTVADFFLTFVALIIAVVLTACIVAIVCGAIWLAVTYLPAWCWQAFIAVLGLAVVTAMMLDI